jgi:hypothetical protein
VLAGVCCLRISAWVNGSTKEAGHGGGSTFFNGGIAFVLLVRRREGGYGGRPRNGQPMTFQRWILVNCIACVLFVVVNSSYTQAPPVTAAQSLSAFAPSPLPPLEGWTSQITSNGAVLNAPGSEEVRPIVTFLPPTRPQGDAKEWFGKQVLTMAQSAGKPGGATELMEKDGVFVRAVEVEDAKRKKVRLAFYGYPTRNGLSAAVLVVPEGIVDADPRLEQAKQYIRARANEKFEVPLAANAGSGNASATPVASGTTRNAQGQYVGAFGRSDIDLTYHAKGIPPKERDVPLKGVYVFVGFAYGGTYGGVGTTMTWGSHAVQQLLLLYENGVAAKVDLRGGNLAGKYQAEGFVSLNVANPAAVSAAPFGHWTEEADAVHIQWNNGKPSDLAKNGLELDAPGERWTPYKLADGDVVQGTFVRKMEAGLRSQAIVLKQDGTFAGDGVNVTMGGSAVSPAFPERGIGRYEIRKGSMILYFQNGFTQAIACILDKTPSGDVKTVLLNGFPFERVR